MLKKIFLALFSVMISACGFAQTTPQSANDSVVYTYAEVMPEFKNGSGGFQEYLSHNVHYPKEEKYAGKQGTVYISFVVEKDGSISNVHAVKEVPNAPGFTAEGIRVIQNMPNWNPGMQNGKPVRIEITQPIRFVLTTNNEDEKGKNKKKKH